MSPLVPLVAGLVVLVAVLAVAVWLRWLRPAGKRTEFHERFGQPMVVAGVVGLGFALVQVATQLELRASDRRAAARDAANTREFARQLQLENARQQLLVEISLRQNLRGIDLHGQDLRGLYLEGKNLSDANLIGANLSRAVLDHAVLDGANLANTDFTSASMVGTQIVDPV